MRLPDKIAMFKWMVKALFYGVLAALFIYALLNVKRPDQSTVIDKTITYTTTATKTYTIPLNITPSPEEVVESISDYVTVPEGGLDWKLLAQTKSIPYSFADEEGREMHGVKPEFPSGLQKLDGREITMQGYMFPLNAEENQSLFLFGPFPVSCPYHYHVGPALVMEARGQDAVKFSYEAVTLTGTLELVPRDDAYNVFYRLHDVKVKP
ncbi:MAG: DUF3299 domain-containing protein [Rhodospirillales bacterium]|nr:DUF3299 domain-containing protein [Rhodospirillales bacterium]